MDDNLALRSMVIVANIIGFVYNIPQIIHTCRTKKAGDISGLFLFLRFTSAILWIIYSSIEFNLDIIISWIITLVSSIVLLYYKYIYKKTEEVELQNDSNV